MNQQTHQIVVTLQSLPARSLELYGGDDPLFSPFAIQGTTFDWCFLPRQQQPSMLNWLSVPAATEDCSADVLTQNYANVQLLSLGDYASDVHFHQQQSAESTDALGNELNMWIGQLENSEASQFLWIHLPETDSQCAAELLSSEPFHIAVQATTRLPLQISLSALMGELPEHGRQTDFSLLQSHLPFVTLSKPQIEHLLAARQEELTTPSAILGLTTLSDDEQLTLLDQTGRPSLLTRRCLYRLSCSLDALETADQIERYYLPDDYYLKNDISQLDLLLMKSVLADFQKLKEAESHQTQ